MRTPTVHICCNDGDNGLFTGKARGVSVGELELDHHDMEHGASFRVDDVTFHLSNKMWPYDWSKEWLGNWCWNAYRLKFANKTALEATVSFLKWLRGRRTFSVTGGPERLWDWWQFKIKLTDEELTREVETMFTPAAQEAAE